MPKPKWLGDLEQIQIANPAAGAAVDIQPPGGQMWLIQGITATLTCSAAVANRYPYMVQRGGAADVCFLVSPVASVALSVSLIGVSQAFTGTPFVTLNQIHFPLGPVYYITNTIFLRLFHYNQDAGDQWSNIWVNYWRMLAE